MVFGPEGAPTAHLVHGWAGWWQQLAAHVPALLDAGYRVVAHDAPSHGSSRPGRHGPRSTTLLEIADAFTAVVHQQGPADLVVAHSLGATATMWASRHGTVAGAYAFLAPMASLVPMLDWFEHVIGLGPATRPRLVDRVERRVGVRLTEFDITTLSRIARDRGATPRHLAPDSGSAPRRLLTIHDRDDVETSAQGSVDIARAWPGSELVLTQGLGHRRIIWHPDVVERVAAFARSYRTELQPSSG